MAKPYFTSEFFGFLSQIKQNNSREWFQANKQRYRQDVQEPLLRFIADFAEPLAEIGPRFVADPRPTGGSMFRIYRDVRFSRDKSPYKTHAAAQFRHQEGRDVHAPGFYLHLEPENVFVGAGLWHPGGPTLAAVRDAIVERPEQWSATLSDPAFAARYDLGGDRLKRAPRGYDPDHPLVDSLRFKDFVSYQNLTEAEAMSPGFLATVADSFRAAAGFVRFLTEAVGLPFD
jgi:uncharacterized protein (TIGR02453 family)